MNEQTEQMVRELAESLGTTTEYLWSVLVRQGPISGTVGVIGLMVAVVLAVTFAILLYKASKMDASTTEGEHTQCIALGICVVGLVCTIPAIWIGLGHLPTSLAGIFNPEYWALKQVLDAI